MSHSKPEVRLTCDLTVPHRAGRETPRGWLAQVVTAIGLSSWHLSHLLWTGRYVVQTLNSADTTGSS